MILKILEKGSTKVYAPDDQVADYLFLGFTDTGTTTEVVVTDPSKEIVEMKIEDDVVTAFRYKGDPVWRTVAGGGGTDTYKVKVDGTDTADYLENKLQQGTNVTITKSGGKLVVNSTASGGSGITVYADLAAIKAVDTTAYTTVQTVQVTSLGLYKFQPASTLVGDDVNVITPTTGSSTGRWIKQSIDLTPVYNFYGIDNGAENTYYSMSQEGNLCVGGTGASTGGAEKGIVTCDELSILGKVIKFRPKDPTLESMPSFFIAANGSYDVKGAAFRAFQLLQNGSTFVIKKHVGSTQTTLKTFYATPTYNNYEITVKHLGNRLSIQVYDYVQNRFLITEFLEDTDLSAFGNFYGFSNNMGVQTIFSNIKISDLQSQGKNIIFGGDSQTSNGAIKNGMDTVSKFARYTKNKNIDCFNTAISGRVAQNVIDNFATEVTARKSLYAENIYYINIGTNDMPSVPIATMKSNILAIVNLAKAAGFKVFITTVAYPANGVSEASQPKLKEYNDYIRSLKSGDAVDFILDFYDPINGFLNANGGINMDLIIKQDGLHFTSILRDKIAQKIYSILNISTMNDIFIGKDSGSGLGIEFTPQAYTKLMKNYTNTVLYSGGRKLTVSDGMVTAVGNVASSVVASAATITVPLDLIFHVSGTTTITTINPPFAGFVGQITIIPDGLFTLATGGNIYEAYTAIVGRAINLVYDGTTWYRVNS